MNIGSGDRQRENTAETRVCNIAGELWRWRLRHDLNGSLDLPAIIEIEPTVACNLRCRMCHVSYMPVEPRPFLQIDLLEQLKCIAGRYVILGSGFEPTIHPDFNRMVRRLTDFDCRLEMISNGTQIDEKMLSVLADANFEILNFSFDGIRKGTYEDIRRHARFEDTIERILRTRERFRGRETYFAINSTMMRRNMDEIMEMIDFWDAADFDVLRLISMVIRQAQPELVRESLYPIRNDFYRILDSAAQHAIDTNKRLVIRNSYYVRSPLRHVFSRNFVGDAVVSANPGARLEPSPRQAYQVGKYPGMSFPCKSPFTFARVMANGDVQLCYQFSVGNLTEASLEDIWYSDAADKVRKKILADTGICEVCDYFRFCLKSADIDTDDSDNYFAANVRSIQEHVNFETGAISVPKPIDPPRLIESIGIYNVVSYAGMYYGIPQALGPIDLEMQSVMNLPGVVSGDSFPSVKQKVKMFL